MYWPWRLRLARRAGERVSFRPVRAGAEDTRAAASIAGPSRPRARMIEESDPRIDWRSRRSDAPRGLGKRTSISKDDKSYYKQYGKIARAHHYSFNEPISMSLGRSAPDEARAVLAVRPGTRRVGEDGAARGIHSDVPVRPER